MKNRQLLFFRLLGASLLAFPMAIQADVRLPSLISDHMVLQRDVPVKIWGWADPGEKVVVSIAEQQRDTVAGTDGKWSVTLDSLKASAPQVLTVKGRNAIAVNDVLVGEVWLAAGQSNMEWPVGKSKEAAEIIADAKQPEIRVFSAANTPAHDPMDDVSGKWTVTTPETVSTFPAVAYEFGREIHKALNVPVGVLTASIGGTPAESWSSLEALSKHVDFKTVADAQRAEMAGFEDNKKKFLADLATWEGKYGGDTGSDPTPGRIMPDAADPSWQDISLPAAWEKIGLSSGGTVWFSKRFDLSEAAAQKGFLINAGNVSYGVRAFLNGKELAQVPGAQPMYCLTPRLFVVPPDLARAKDNVLSLRIFTHTDVGQYGFTLQDMWFPLAAPQTDNVWRKLVESTLPPIDAAAKAQLPVSPSPAPQLTATYNFNGLIHPMISYAIRGVIWYQGESNVERAGDYERLLSDLITDWRGRWGKPEMPFYFVQLPNFGGWPTANTWAKLREAQGKAAAVPNTGMAVAIDLGESKDIHPTEKKVVAHRLALLASHRTYGQSVEDAAPLYESMAVEGSSIRVKFSKQGGPLSMKGDALKQFVIAGSDQKFVTATALIDGDDVVVSSRLVKNPVAVRYAWSNDPAGCNLQGANGLPVAPFRTDDW